MGGNTTAALHAAKKAKKDEFYTQRVDIENELRHYKAHFKDKTVLCNCDDPRQSEFFKYFVENFEKLGLKKLVATCYKSQDVDLFSQGDCEKAICQIYEGDKNGNMRMDDDEINIRQLKGDGDFRSAECIEILKEADIVVTNPPFSLFREYVAQLVKFGVRWFTNLDYPQRHETLPLYKKYTPEEFPKYDNYDAINVNKTSDIPYDYDGVMGVLITFMDKYCPEQFEILGITNHGDMAGIPFANGNCFAEVNGKRMYVRIFIRRRSK